MARRAIDNTARRIRAGIRIQRDLGVFLILFFLLWTCAVAAVWQHGALPEAARPWFRNAVWLGAVLIWIRWQRPAAALAWLGVAPVTASALATAIAAAAVLLTWNVLRVNGLDAPLGRLAALTPAAAVWGLVGVTAEELLFRGVVQTQLRRAMGQPLAIPLAAALFLGIHVPGWWLLALPVTPMLAVSVFLIGAICGVLRGWTDSIWPAVAAHYANNIGALL